MIVLRFLHIAGFTVWIGGMFFAHLALRPVVAAQLEGPARAAFLRAVFKRFFPWVWLAVALILGSGLAMMANESGGPPYARLMGALGIIMMMIFAHVFFSPYRRLGGAIAGGDGPAAVAALGQIRRLIGFNLVLGLITLAIGALGPLTV